MSKKRNLFLFIFCLPVFFGIQAQAFKRDIRQNMFVPKGQWIVGSNISYSEYSGNNYNFLVVEGLTAQGHSIRVSPVLAYVFHDNIAAGGRFRYHRSMTHINEANIVLSDDNKFDLSDAYSLSHTYSGAAILRNYISLGSSKRFALFNEAQFEIGGKQSKVINGKGQDLTGTYETSTEYNLAVSPGLVAFINNFIAVELNIGVLGFSYSHLKQVTDQVEMGDRKTHNASFKINLFSIGLGIALYL